MYNRLAAKRHVRGVWNRRIFCNIIKTSKSFTTQCFLSNQSTTAASLSPMFTSVKSGWVCTIFLGTPSPQPDQSRHRVNFVVPCLRLDQLLNRSIQIISLTRCGDRNQAIEHFMYALRAPGSVLHERYINPPFSLKSCRQ